MADRQTGHKAAHSQRQLLPDRLRGQLRPSGAVRDTYHALEMYFPRLARGLLRPSALFDGWDSTGGIGAGGLASAGGQDSCVFIIRATWDNRGVQAIRASRAVVCRGADVTAEAGVGDKELERGGILKSRALPSPPSRYSVQCRNEEAGFPHHANPTWD